MESTLNDYHGYKPVVGLSTTIDRVKSDISPEEFFTKYVSQRRPVVLEGHLTDARWKTDKWSNKYLSDEAGGCKVLVEKRDDKTSGSFGIGAPKVEMEYSKFLTKLQERDESLYLTTQDLERGSELDDYGMPMSVMANPLCHLTSNFPLRPALLGNLIPYHLSLWQGFTKNGTTSGLHHDFHDNLYILIRGRKRFRLFSPAAVQLLRTKGNVCKIHSNGLIVYSDDSLSTNVPVRADGVPLSFLTQHRRQQIEEHLSQYEDELDVVKNSTTMTSEEKSNEVKRLESLIEETEERLEDVMEEALNWADSNSSVTDKTDDDDDDDDDDNINDNDAGVSRRPRLHVSNGSSSKRLKTSHSSHNHFCELVLPPSDSELEGFLQGICDIGCMSVTLSAGEMLYLPASWFHEVTSYSCDSDSTNLGHLAFNYWTFPPDSCDFSKPYLDPFWSERWESVVKEHMKHSSLL